MKKIDYKSVTGDALQKIKKGAFLTVRDKGRLNTMTIGWALFGHIWRRPVLMVAVRASRHPPEEGPWI